MMKGLCKFFLWVSLLILSELQYSGTNSCLHDDDGVMSRVKRSTNEEYYRENLLKHVPNAENSHNGKPIRIRPVYYLSKHLLKEEKVALQNVLQQALSKIESLLSVTKGVDGPLLLERKSACPVVLGKGINKGKCSRLQKGYKGEFCLDNLKIPSEHLKGLAIYNRTSPDPIKVYRSDGEGLADTDFVLYVTSESTQLCNPYKSSALAYAAACQLDELGRPIAGQVNFCPRTLKANKFDRDLLYKTAIHELFHALGFSSKLFAKFVTCDEDGTCQPRHQPLVRSVNGIKRLVTPAVVREMRQHFQCEEDVDFGGPLQTVNDKATSHWDSILMHSSIMTAREQKPYLTLIDRITLAVFEDSGWYGVNYSQADPFIWGKGKGCNFGIEEKCTYGFCSNNHTGCHHLRLSKAKCNANSAVHPSGCGVFTADQNPCFLETSKTSQTHGDETFSSKSRCFMSSLSSQAVIPEKMRGRCYESKCEANEVYVRVLNGEWILCHPGSKVQVDKYMGSITCPPTLEICTSFHIPDLPQASSTLSPSPSYYFNQSENVAYSRPLQAKMHESPEEEKEKNQRLYVEVKFSKEVGDFSDGDRDITRALGEIVKKYGLLFYSLSNTHDSGRSRYCLIVEVPDGGKMEFKVLKKILYRELSSKAIGRYSRYKHVDVLTSHCYFCRSISYSSNSANRKPRKLPAGCGGGGAHSLQKFPLVLTCTLVGLVIWIVKASLE